MRRKAFSFYVYAMILLWYVYLIRPDYNIEEDFVSI